MKHYKDENNNIYAYEADGSQDAYIPSHLIAITDEEADALREPPPKSLAEQAEDVRVALQNAIDNKAKSLSFSSGNALMLYAGFTNPFQTLAQTFATWEASVWVEADAYKAEVLSGNKLMLTPNEAVLMMPNYPE